MSDKDYQAQVLNGFKVLWQLRKNEPRNNVILDAVSKMRAHTEREIINIKDQLIILKNKPDAPANNWNSIAAKAPIPLPSLPPKSITTVKEREVLIRINHKDTIENNKKIGEKELKTSIDKHIVAKKASDTVKLRAVNHWIKVLSEKASIVVPTFGILVKGVRVEDVNRDQPDAAIKETQRINNATQQMVRHGWAGHKEREKVTID